MWIQMGGIFHFQLSLDATRIGQRYISSNLYSRFRNTWMNDGETILWDAGLGRQVRVSFCDHQMLLKPCARLTVGTLPAVAARYVSLVGTLAFHSILVDELHHAVLDYFSSCRRVRLRKRSWQPQYGCQRGNCPAICAKTCTFVLPLLFSASTYPLRVCCLEKMLTEHHMWVFDYAKRITEG